MTTIKITELTNIGANLASTTVFPVVNMSGTPTTEKTVLGNIANVILSGAGGNYVAVGAATLAGTVTTNAQPNITSTGSLTGLTVSNAAGTVNFSNTANVTLGAVGNLHIAGGTAGQLLSTNGNGTLSWASDTTTYGNSNVVTLLSAFGSNTITTTGNVSVGNIIGNGQALTNIAGANVSGFVPNANVANTAFAVAAANVTGLGNIATINLDGSTSNVLYGNGVFAAVAGGANIGNVTFDDVTVQGDNNSLNLSAGSDFTANLAYLQVRAGDVASHIHLDTGNNDAYDLIVGDDQNYVQVSSTGNILLSSYDSNTAQYIWTLDYNGNLILAGGNSVIQSIANSSLDPTLPNVSTMVLTPDANYNSQVLVLDPTAPGHIHLRAYAFSNIDEPAANIFLGGEDTAFEVTSGANNEARIHSGGNTWTFGNDGRLTFPGTPRIDTDSNNFEVQAAEAINFEANAVVNIYTDAGNNAFQWQFGDDGNLTLPGDIVGTANANFTIYSNAAAHEFIFGDDGTFYAPDNVVLGGTSIYIGPGANTLTGIEHEVFIASSNNFAYVQAVVNNVSDNGSADWVALGAKGDDTGGQASMGFTSSGFADANYSITGNGDGYVFVQSYAPGQTLLGGGGNLVLTTGSQGTTKDIIFGTGGFLSSNIFGRISHANNSLELSRAGATITFPDATEQTTAYINPSVTGNWTLATGNNTVNISVPLNGTYAIWVNGNIPNGIVTYTATAVITNTNVPVLGEQYAWYYAVGNALVLTSIPNQFVGTVGSISNVNTYLGNTANVFTFGITNNSGNTAVVNYGYTKL